MERRTCERSTSNINIKFRCCHRGCDGVAKNLSKTGMFISTDEICFPMNDAFDIFVPSDGKVLRIPVAVSRIVLSTETEDGVGIAFLKSNRDH